MEYLAAGVLRLRAEVEPHAVVRRIRAKVDRQRCAWTEILHLGHEGSSFCKEFLYMAFTLTEYGAGDAVLFRQPSRASVAWDVLGTEGDFDWIVFHWSSDVCDGFFCVSLLDNSFLKMENDGRASRPPSSLQEGGIRPRAAGISCCRESMP